MIRTRFIGVLILLLLLGAGGFWFWHRNPSTVVAEQTDVIPPPPPGPVIDVQERTVVEGDVFTKVMEDLGVSYGDALTIVTNAADVFDLTNIKVGRTFKLISEDGVRARVEYEPGTEYAIKIDLENGLAVTKELIKYDVTVETTEVTIDASLFEDGLAAGMSEQLIIAFANIFAWEIDFATVVQKGDHMNVLYEKRMRDGKEAPIGNILAGEFTNSGTTVSAFRFVGADGKEGYFNEEGDSLVRPFLKSPLAFGRVTSGYNYARMDPVIGVVQPHRAIDYAAPLGTPIMAVGDGNIIRASWNGPYGNEVMIRHNSQFQTNYAHLWKFAKGIKPGVHVSQGQTIGFVGSTGRSTGPHVHYEVVVNGTKVNPQDVKFPKGESIGAEEQEAFEAERDRLKGMME
ncbi:peptidoglycan DD-metalloendopeptidase family protein [Candidatus Uhrbacteria bacterium]|nr:peptidoglycan DD-metalloendopeptidase family protein [Candidatus Uhrbacteria bacterium]